MRELDERLDAFEQMLWIAELNLRAEEEERAGLSREAVAGIEHMKAARAARRGR